MFNGVSGICRQCEYRMRQNGCDTCSLYGEPLAELDQAIIPGAHCSGYEPMEFSLGNPSQNTKRQAREWEEIEFGEELQ